MADTILDLSGDARRRQPSIDLECRNGRKEPLTPLQIAALHGYADVVKILLDRGAQVNDRGGADWSALQAAKENGYTSIVEMLTRAGAH